MTIPRSAPDYGVPVASDQNLTPGAAQDDPEDSLIRWIVENPKRANVAIEVAAALAARQNPAFFRELADARRRMVGVWVGVGLTLTCLASGVAILLTSSPVLIGFSLLVIGSACAGGTFAVITGSTVSPSGFARMLTARAGASGETQQQRSPQ
jgi:hypothetical protein